MKPSPIRTMPTASQPKSGVLVTAMPAPIAAMDVDPVAPKQRAMPYRKKAVAKLPSRKYLRAD